MTKTWDIKTPNPKLQKKLSNELDCHPIVAQLLINRGIQTLEAAKQFLEADKLSFHDPFLLKDMDRAVERIKKAQKNKEKVLVFGDYDADGVTATVLLSNALTKMNIDIIHHIPHRMDDGYGLNHEISEYAKENGVSLLVCADCGITGVEEVETLNSMGIDVIIVDHHMPDEQLPNAYAVVDPKRKDCLYPFKDLAAVGLVAKLIHALTNEMSDEVFDLTAIGTIADVVPLVGENRLFVKKGLANINNTKNKGLRALLETSKIKGKTLKPFHIGFILGPRINAAGRMDTAHDSLDLFLAQDSAQAYTLALGLEKSNSDRQKLQRSMIQEALDIVEKEINFQDHKVIVVSKEGWHKGVLGIVASRIVEKYYRPTIVISVDEGVGTASARSIDGFHLYDALSDCAEFLERFGGHAGAAGLTIIEDNIDPFRNFINEIVRDKLEVEKLVPSISIDCDIPFGCVTMDLADVIDSMEPFGEGNPTPIFCTRNLTVKSKPQILARETLKFWVTDGDISVSAVGFGMAKYKDLVEFGSQVDLAYEISIDDWNKAPTVQLKLKDIKRSK